MSSFLRTRDIEAAIAQLPATIRAAYPPHLFEPVRIRIACELIVKEYYKLFPFMTAAQMGRLPANTLGWLNGTGYTMDPVCDFWNLIDGQITSLKLKDLIVPLLTSAHVHWQLEDIDPRHLELYAALGTLGQLGTRPFTYAFIKKHILDDPIQLRINRADSDQHANDTKLPRDNFPIPVLRELDGSLHLLDGNRRCMRAYLYHKPTIKAWVGTVTQSPTMYNHWINTGLLCRMLSDYQQRPTAKAATALRTQFQQLFKASCIARLHFEDRCVKHFPFAKQLILEEPAGRQAAQAIA